MRRLQAAEYTLKSVSSSGVHQPWSCSFWTWGGGTVVDDAVHTPSDRSHTLFSLCQNDYIICRNVCHRRHCFLLSLLGEPGTGGILGNVVYRAMRQGAERTLCAPPLLRPLCGFSLLRSMIPYGSRFGSTSKFENKSGPAKK